MRALGWHVLNQHYGSLECEFPFFRFSVSGVKNTKCNYKELKSSVIHIIILEIPDAV